MNKKKVLAMVLALVLVCALSVTGTLAYLQAKTETPVVNTFVAAGGGKLIGDNGEFVLAEHKAAANTSGVYSLGTEEVTENSYNVLPGMTIPKDPFIRITEKTSAPAYLYVEVVGTLDSTVYTYSIDSAWTQLSGVTGPNGGKVYVYSTVVTDTTDLTSIGILKDNKIAVADASDLKLSSNNTLSFYGYLAQASVGDSTGAADVFKTVFMNTANP